MPRLTPEAGAEKLVRRASGAIQDYVAGVKSVTESPTAQAAKNLDKAAMNFQEAVSSGRMARRLNSVTRESWINDTVAKGQARYGPGITAAKDKILAFNQEFYPYLDRVSAEVRALPSMTIDDSINRASVAIRRLHEFQRR